MDVRLEGDCVVITPRKLVTSEAWEKLLQVMNSVHEQNTGTSEEEVYQVCGGTKGTQPRDITRARNYWNDFLQQIKEQAQ